MARQLKSDLNELKRIFTRNHERFRILAASDDEVTCKFILKDGQSCDIQANILDYPKVAPLWCVLNDDESVTNALEMLSGTSGRDNHIINQIKILIEQLCSLYDVPIPADLDKFSNISNDQQFGHLSSDRDSDDGSDKDTGNGSDEVSDNEMGEDDQKSENVDDDEIDKSRESDEDVMLIAEETEDTDIDVENAMVIKRQNELQYQSQRHSIQSSSKILLKELDSIYRSETYKSKIFTIELIDDSLYEWKVDLYSVCSDSLLSKDLVRLKEAGGKGSIEMRVMFKETHPFYPPFIQVTYPAIKGGHVLDAGALCMELLTNDGWSSVLSMENVFLQISSTFITGNARVNFELTKQLASRPHSLEAAKKMFAYHEKHHAKNGWVTPANHNS